MISPLAKRIAYDTAGYCCLIALPFLGPLPGPGGIPLLLLGLSLLAKHNKWAANLLLYVQKHSKTFRSILFPNKRRIQWLWDAIALALGGITALEIVLLNGKPAALLPIITISLALTVFLCNRSRIERITKRT